MLIPQFIPVDSDYLSTFFLVCMLRKQHLHDKEMLVTTEREMESNIHVLQLHTI